MFHNIREKFSAEHHGFLTLIAVPDGVEVYVTLFVEEDKGEPGVEGVDGNEEKNPYNPSLFCRITVVP